MSDQRNLIIAIALSIAIFVGWTFLFPPAPAPNKPTTPNPAATVEGAAPGLPGVVAPTAATPMTREQALRTTQRVVIDAPRVSGSINLTGARLDDLRLRTYHETTDRTSPTITLLSPAGTPNAYYGEFGWTAPQGSQLPVPNQNTVWQVERGNELRADVPVTLRWDNGQGLIFRVTYAIDQNYMFTVAQEVENRSGSEVTLTPFGVISRYETTVKAEDNVWFLHEGFVGWIEDSLKNRKWKKLREDGGLKATSTGGWVGFADKYWLTALAPPQTAPFHASTGVDQPGGVERFATAYQLDPAAVAVGATAKTESHFFAGAKEVKTVGAYRKSAGITRFDLAIDWGWFRFLTEPVFFLLDFFFKIFGNFGVAILAVTLVVKILFFPLANKSYETMSKMKKLQPQLKVIQERYKDDKVSLQKEMMGLYQKEKINPLAGCLPVLLQIPVFYSLYNVLFVTIEMRHAPFFGWIQDLSAKDPTTIFNLFGLIPWDPPSFLLLGLWPIIMGITMFVQTSLTPMSADPTQKLIFTWMPVLFTFMLAAFPAGLVIYWTWNNILSVIQQVALMQMMGTPVDIKSALGINWVSRKLSGKPKPPDKPVAPPSAPAQVTTKAETPGA